MPGQPLAGEFSNPARRTARRAFCVSGFVLRSAAQLSAFACIGSASASPRVLYDWRALAAYSPSQARFWLHKKVVQKDLVRNNTCTDRRFGAKGSLTDAARDDGAHS